MEEIRPGIFHWTTFHEGIGEEVHSSYIAMTDPPVLIDPRVPPEGLEWFSERGFPRHAYLTNRHHFRHSDRFRQAFGTTVWCHRAGLHEFPDDPLVQAFEHGDELPGGLFAWPVGTICPEETAFYLPADGGMVALGDALIRPDGELGFVPDALLGENPSAVKRGLREVFRGFLGRNFEHLLFAHGEPWVGGAREGLAAFLAAG